jgi:hypothetical protein
MAADRGSTAHRKKIEMSNTKQGTDLCAEDQRHVLSAYVHRYTGEHTPQWVRRATGTPPLLQFKDDADWLAHTRFRVRRDGRLDGRVKSCESSPTWPNDRARLESEKLDYLYAFEDAFRKQCQAASIDAARWKQGMWTNAHMYHGMGLPVEEGVRRWFQHVSNQSQKSLR